MADKMDDKKAIKDQSDLVKSVNDLKADSLAKEKLNVASSKIVPPSGTAECPNWKLINFFDQRDHVILEMRGELTKSILQHLAEVQATVVQSDDANLSYSISVPKEKIEQTKNFFREQNATIKG